MDASILPPRKMYQIVVRLWPNESWRLTGPPTHLLDIPEWILYHPLHGEGQIHHTGGFLPVQTGDVVLCKPHVPARYRFDATQPITYLTSVFRPRPHWLEWLDWPERAAGIMALRLNDPLPRRRVQRCLLRATKLMGSIIEQRVNLMMAAMEEALLWCDAVNPKKQSKHLPAPLRAAVEHIHRFLHRKLALSELAQAAGISPGHLSHQFRKVLGLTTTGFIEQQRMVRAQELLRLTNLSIKQIAAEIGFQNQYYFSLRFKHHTEMSPSRYRVQQSTQAAAGGEAPANRPHPASPHGK